MILTGAQIVIEVLAEQGVDMIFGYPGGSVLPIYEELYHQKHRIRHILTADEQGAAFAADGYARATDRVGVCMATSGPGATNLVTGIASAFMDSVPMVAITGNVPTGLIGQDSFQEVYIAGITLPITKHNFYVTDVNQLADILRKAFAIAQSGRKGPVLVDIPKDISTSTAEYEPEPSQTNTYRTKIVPEQIEEAARLINQAKRPVIYCGGGVTASCAGAELAELAGKADIPVTHTLMAAGVMGYGERLNLGMLGMHGWVAANQAIAEADLVLAIGTRFSDRVAQNRRTFAGKAKILQIDIDPSEVNKNVQVDYSILGDVKDVLTALLPKINKRRHPSWMKMIEGWKQEDYHPVDSEEVLKPHQIIGIIGEMTGEEAIYTTDVGQHQMWTAQYLKHLTACNFLTSGGLGAMGYGYGAAIGAKLAKPEKPVIHITGDGSFHMNLTEACTAVSYKLPIITVIMNNSVLGMVRQLQTYFNNGLFMATEPERETDFVKVAEGFGCIGYRATTPAEFREVFAKALKSERPVWIDCIVDREERVLPMIPPGKGVESVIMH